MIPTCLHLFELPGSVPSTPFFFFFSAELLRGVDQAEEMLRFHILQGKQNERGNFSVKIDSEKAERMASHEQLTHIDEEQIPLEEKPLVSTHKPPNK